MEQEETAPQPPPPPQQQHQHQVGGTLDRRAGTGGRRTAPNQRGPQEKTGNGTSIVHQPLPDPPTLAPQPLSAAHFTQYRSPAPPTLPCCNQSNAQSQHRSQNRSSRTPEKFFSTSSQSIRPPGDQQRGMSRQSHSHTLDRRHGYSNQTGQGGQSAQQNARAGSQTLDRRGRQALNPRSTSLAPLDNHQSDANRDQYAVTEL